MKDGLLILGLGCKGSKILQAKDIYDRSIVRELSDDYCLVCLDEYSADCIGSYAKLYKRDIHFLTVDDADVIDQLNNMDKYGIRIAQVQLVYYPGELEHLRLAHWALDKRIPVAVTKLEREDFPVVNYRIYTDGSGTVKDSPGGWACIYTDHVTGKKVELSGNEEETTNNRMELTAALRGLQTLRYSHNCTYSVEIVSDSQYVVNGINTWRHKWCLQHWHKARNELIANDDLWRQIDLYCELHGVTASWVRGHSGHPLNEKCDALANLQRLEVKCRLEQEQNDSDET